MWKTAIVFVWTGLFMGCGPMAHEARESPKIAAPFNYRLDVRLTSDLPELYYVTSGPAESYERFRVNDRFREELEDYARRRSNPSARPLAHLDIQLLEVTTSYREYGASSDEPGFGSIRKASHRMWAEWDGPSIPAEITRQVALKFHVEIRTEQRAVRTENVKGEAVEVIDRDHWDPHWAYDYSEVMRAAIRESVAAVDRIAQKALD